jgi:hypothetical protein
MKNETLQKDLDKLRLMEKTLKHEIEKVVIPY